ncbi:MAG: DUF192 domain-containing protein [Candidatus Hydrothermarchaeaceae archaeon]
MVDVYRGDLRICRAREASNFFGRARGLMFKRRLEKGEGLLIEFSSLLKSCSIHSFFMRFAIDLIFIDSGMSVVDMKTLVPWKIYSTKGDCRWVLEVSEGTIEENNIKPGDVLTFHGLIRP